MKGNCMSLDSKWLVCFPQKRCGEEQREYHPSSRRGHVGLTGCPRHQTDLRNLWRKVNKNTVNKHPSLHNSCSTRLHFQTFLQARHFLIKRRWVVGVQGDKRKRIWECTWWGVCSVAFLWVWLFVRSEVSRRTVWTCTIMCTTSSAAALHSL